MRTIRARCRCGFNPRPPSLASGAWHKMLARARQKFQSTPAIAGERCAAAFHEAVDDYLVSIHARHRWRAVRCLSVSIEDVGTVSIHARHRWRAVHSTLTVGAAAAVFQSTPAIAGERCVRAQAKQAVFGRVSIHARHRWRAVPDGGQSLDDLIAVSIHARHRWRAVRWRARWRGSDEPVSIHARHRWRAVLPRVLPPLPSSLVSIHARHRWRAVRQRRAWTLRKMDVSIHARHRWRAVPRDRCAPAVRQLVSIHARHRWRAVPAAMRSVLTLTSFQSTPAIAGERCWPPLARQ